MNQKEEFEDDIQGIVLIVVDDHEYLGTYISNDGLRNVEIGRRAKDARSVSNDIVQLLRVWNFLK